MRSSNDNAFRVRLMALSSSLSEKENLQRNHRHPRQSCQTFAAPNRLAAAWTYSAFRHPVCPGWAFAGNQSELVKGSVQSASLFVGLRSRIFWARDQRFGARRWWPNRTPRPRTSSRSNRIGVLRRPDRPRPETSWSVHSTFSGWRWRCSEEWEKDIVSNSNNTITILFGNCYILRSRIVVRKSIVLTI